MSLLRHMAFMDTLAALGWSICATGAGATSHVEAPARLVGQHQNPAKWRTVLALLRYTHLPYSVASDSKLLETSRGLGTGGPAGQRARWGESKERAPGSSLYSQSLRDTVLNPILVIEHDYGLNNRCYPEPLWRNSDLTSSSERR